MTKIFFPSLDFAKDTTDLHKLHIILGCPLSVLRYVSLDVPYGEVCYKAELRLTHCFHFTYRLPIKTLKINLQCEVFTLPCYCQ